jgi:hypothetical protein
LLKRLKQFLQKFDTCKTEISATAAVSLTHILSSQLDSIMSKKEKQEEKEASLCWNATFESFHIVLQDADEFFLSKNMM